MAPVTPVPPELGSPHRTTPRQATLSVAKATVSTVRKDHATSSVAHSLAWSTLSDHQMKTIGIMLNTCIKMSSRSG